MKALRSLNLDNVVFIDIETARVVKELKIDTPLFDSWAYTKSRENLSNDEIIATFKQEAGLYAEFGRIVCISIGKIQDGGLKLHTYNQESEKELLEVFNKQMRTMLASNPKLVLCGHAVKGFDVPYIFKRSLINGIEPVSLIDNADQKPWDVTHVDTKDLWRGTSFRPSSLINIAVAFGLPSPKDDISGAEVGDLYWSDEPKRIKRISNYCEKDVLTTANVVRKCRFEEPLLPLISNEEIKVKKLPLIFKVYEGGKFGKEEEKELESVLDSLPPEDLGPAFNILTMIAGKRNNKMTKKYINGLKSKYATTKEG